MVCLSICVPFLGAFRKTGSVLFSLVSFVLIGEVNAADFAKGLVQKAHGEDVSSNVGRIFCVKDNLVVERIRPNITTLKPRFDLVSS